MQAIAGAGTAVCHNCGNEWRALSNKKRYRCPVCGKYQAHFTPLEEKQSAVSTPEIGEVIIGSPGCRSESVATSPLLFDGSGEVTAHCKENLADTGEKRAQGSLKYVAWILFLIGVAWISWYVWRSARLRRRKVSVPTPKQMMYGYERLSR